jgi:hypothetical protein
MKYDSTKDTLTHIKRVGELLGDVIDNLDQRAIKHDQSKLEDPEKETFDKFTPLLKDSTYGSDEYKGFLKSMGVALEHHYKNNSHHPEHYEKGISGMDLFDVIEMLFDWKAATERHDNGDIRKSLIHNKLRFNISDQLNSILKNTVDRMNW